MGSHAKAVVCAIAVVLMPMSDSLGCLKNSAHDMNPPFPAQASVVRRNSDICGFCHTPTRRDSNTERPSWQHSYIAESAAVSVPQDGSAVSPTLTQGESATLICLTCHDGTQALDINPRLYGGAIGSGAHPVGVPYGGAREVLNPRYARDLVDPDYAMPVADVINNTKVWWVDTNDVRIAGKEHQGEPQTREKSDLLLFVRARDDDRESVPHVECASCHDPHQCETQSFLRIDNERSALCVACHAGI